MLTKLVKSANQRWQTPISGPFRVGFCVGAAFVAGVIECILNVLWENEELYGVK